MNHKKLLIGCGCALLAIALVVCLVLVIGNGAGDKPTLPSNGTTQETTPDGTTVTDPSGNTDPTGPDASDPTTPSSGVTEPTDPNPTVGPGEQETTPPPTDPSTGEEIIPTENPDNNYTQPVGGTHEFGNITPATIRASDWNSWGAERQQAFLDQYVHDGLSAEEWHNVILATWYNDFSCGMEGHSCKAADYHNYLIEMMMRGCQYCGATDCQSFFGKDEYLFTCYDETLCPEYSKEKDPTYYCTDCGMLRARKGNVGDEVCVRASSPTSCPYCGENIPAGCHHCVKK